jgi:hypothetical protein
MILLNFLQNLPYKMKIEGAQNFIEKQDIDLVEEFSI